MTKIINVNRDSFLEIIEKIESEFPLDYNQKINRLFEEFLYKLENLSEYDDELKSRVNRIWAERGFSIEKHFSKQKDIKNFDFYPKYIKLMKFDSLMIRKFSKGQKFSKVIFVGSGPLPLSLKLLRIDSLKVGYDISKEAVELAKKSVKRDRFARRIIYKQEDFFKLKIEEKRPIIIYIAGLIQNKIEGIERIIKQVPKNSLIVVRTVNNDKRELLYERVKKNNFLKYGQVKEYNPTLSSGIVNGMIIIKKVR